ncbi:MAG: c-type cytochrome [Bacteroidota bacterium]
MILPQRLSFIILLSLSYLWLSSCQDTSKIDTSEFILAKNLKIEIVASEPDVILPVAMVEDGKNRFWVIEMPGYMRDINGSDEDLPDGRIVILTDEDQDGKIDERKIFIDSLVNPRAICHVYGGVLFTDGTMLKWAEIDHDKPVNTVVVDSFYVVGGNIEHQPNGLLYNLDNWIYSAKSNARYRRMDGGWKKEATTFRGQWGISHDRMGRLIYNHNSAPLIGDYAIPNQVIENPYLKVEFTNGNYLTDDMRLFPFQATSVNRGYLPEVLDSTGKVIHYTSACSPHLYYGDKLGDNHYNSFFVCGPEGNLVSNYIYNEKDLTAERILENTEFLISKEETFRPVSLMTGYDGSLYVIDMRKGIIQHSAYMSSYLREAITEKGLERINGLGRIYRISQVGSKYKPLHLDGLSTKELTNLFSNPNFAIRMFAQKELVSRNDKEDIPLLKDLTRKANSTIELTHALWTLEGLKGLSSEFILEIASKTHNRDVLTQLIVLSKLTGSEIFTYKEFYANCLKMNSKPIDFLLATVAGKSAELENIWFTIAGRYPNDNEISEALVSSIPGKEIYFLNLLKSSKNDTLINDLNATIYFKKSNEIQTPILINEPFDDDRTNGLKKFKIYCASCHGLNGKGQKNVAPSFKESRIINGDEKMIASIILHGYISGNENYQIMMPAYKEDKNLSDQDIVDIISYLKSTFTADWSGLKVEDIPVLREQAMMN